MGYDNDRLCDLRAAHPDLFESEREARLPVWAQIKIAELRTLLTREAENHSLTLRELEAMENRGRRHR